MKFPDLFYIKQTRALNDLHDFSVNRLASFNKRNNPQNAYDSEWGLVQFENLTNQIQLSRLKPESINRILRHKIQSSGFASRPELDRDTLRMEIIQANIEYEINRLNFSRSVLIGWIQTVLLWAVLILLSFRLNG